MILRRLGLMIAALLLAASPARSGQPVDVELALAADGSGSIDEEELRLQRQGYADAITHPDVLLAITGGPLGVIALTYTEWGGPDSQHTIVDWMPIRDAASARAFADALVRAPRAAQGYNSISHAIDYAVARIEGNAYDGTARVIDVSGDGPQIGGRDVHDARDDAVAKGITINGLVIRRSGTLAGPFGERLEEHYRNDVIGGIGAFVMVADADRSFAVAVRRKLILEIAGAGRAEEIAQAAPTVRD
jgi:hypothetical protein